MKVLVNTDGNVGTETLDDDVPQEDPVYTNV